MNIDKIVDALKIIQEVCRENDRCFNCPLYCSRKEMCGLTHRPDSLIISTPTLNIIK